MTPSGETLVKLGAGKMTIISPTVAPVVDDLPPLDFSLCIWG